MVTLRGGSLASQLDGPVQELVVLLLFVETLKNFHLPWWHVSHLAARWKHSNKHINDAVELLKTKKIRGDKNELQALNNELQDITSGGIRSIRSCTAKESEVIRFLNVELALKLLLLSTKGPSPLDGYLNGINASITVVERSSQEYADIKKYMENSADQQSNYQLSIEEVFKFDRKEDETKFDSAVGNSMLLWHGSPIENMPSILSQGLMIHPPTLKQHTRQGSIFFADRIGKSAFYCHAKASNDIHLVLLCEVALGKVHEDGYANSFDELPPGKNSCKRNGRIKPDMVDVGTTADGVLIPFGKNMKAPEDSKNPREFNEFIIYKNSQVRIRYLVKTKFTFDI